MAVTVKDIAAEVGVNHTTVSRALTGKAQVAKATRRRILEAVERMGYRPSTAARTVRTGRTGLIGMIQSAVGGRSVRVPLFDVSVDRALHAAGQCVVRDLIDEPADSGDEHALSPKILRERVVDGLLINYVLGTPPEIREVLERWEIPAIWINRKREHDCVRPDDEGGARKATRRLIEAGHRDIALCLARSSGAVHRIEPHYSLGDREAGYRNAMREAGLRPRVIDIAQREGTDRRNATLRGSIALLSRPNRPTAVLCGSGSGPTMVAAAWKLGLDVPRDLSVLAFDNEETSDSHIAVDRVLIPYDEMARAAVRELLALIDDPKTPRAPVILPLAVEATGTVAPLSEPSRNGEQE
jgi:LacI family transcriptional regulator, galactose operon repressor